MLPILEIQNFGRWRKKWMNQDHTNWSCKWNELNKNIEVKNIFLFLSIIHVYFILIGTLKHWFTKWQIGPCLRSIKETLSSQLNVNVHIICSLLLQAGWYFPPSFKLALRLPPLRDIFSVCFLFSIILLIGLEVHKWLYNNSLGECYPDNFQHFGFRLVLWKLIVIPGESLR